MESASSRCAVLVTAPLFAIPFGLVGLSGCWRALGAEWTSAVGVVVTVASAVLAVGLAVPWLSQLVRRETSLWDELRDPARGPSVPVIAIIAMLLSVSGVFGSSALGRASVDVFACLSVGGGVAVVTAWLVTRLPLRAYHLGFYLPTAGGSLLTAQCMADLGHGDLARTLFFLGLASWLVLGVVTTIRLVRTPLPPPLRPVMVIELAAPALASNTYLVVFGRYDAYAVALTTVTVLVAALQVALLPYYRRAPFGPASWSAAFSCATAAALALRWVGHLQPADAVLWRVVVMALASGVVLQLGASTWGAARRGRFLTRPGMAPATRDPAT